MESPIVHKMSREEFVQLLTDKAHILKKHLKTTQSDLVICTNINLNTASFKLYNFKEENSLKLYITISNLGDIEEKTVPIIGTTKLSITRVLSHAIIQKFLNCNFVTVIYIR